MSNPFPTLASLNGVSPDAYAQAETYVMGLLKTNFPDRDFGYGKALYWNVVVPAAVATAVMQTNAEIMGSSLSLKWIRDNPALVDPALGEAVLANYYQTLGAGAVSQGSVAIVVSKSAPYAVAAGTTFTANGVTYAATGPIFAQTSAGAVQDTTDRLLTPRSDGTFQFLVPVASQNVGVATFAPRNAVLTMENPIPNLVTVVAATDISGGQDAQTVAQVAATLPLVFAAQVFGGRSHISALIAASFPGTKTASIGFGDPEQWRDTHNLMQVQSGGMVDLYEATQTSIGSEVLTLTATLLDVTKKTWQVVIPRDLAAGIYAAVGVVPQGDTRATMPLLGTQRSVSIPATGFKPLITVPAEAAFSAYQALTIQFTDIYGDHSGLSNGATRAYDVSVIMLPLIQEITDFLNTGMTTKADNVLVRAAVPCVVRITFGIHLLDSDSLTDAEVASIKQAIVNKVAARGFGYGVLSSAIIADAVHGYISGRSDVAANTITMRGDIYAPTGEILVLDGDELVIPEAPEKMVTKNNTVFLTDVSRIDVALIPVTTP